MTTMLKRQWLVMSCLLFVTFPTWSADQPDPAQESQRQEQRERELRQEQEVTPDIRLPRTEKTVEADDIFGEESPCFVISTITLNGESAERFQFALQGVTTGEKSVLGHCLGARGINAVLTRIQNAVVTQGYVTTRVLAMPQNLAVGQLVLTVIPGRIRAIRFTPDSSPRSRYDNALPANPGDILNLRDIEQTLENLKRIPTAEADIQIEPAEANQPGTSDLVIRYQQKFPVRLTLSADDGGVESTGRMQSSATISGDNLLALNDLFYFSSGRNLGGGHTGYRGIRNQIAHYSLPWDYWMMGVTASEYSYYQSIAGLNQTYKYRGEGSYTEAKLSRLIYRDERRKTMLSWLIYLRTAKNYVNDTEIQVQRRRMAGWQGAIDHREAIGSTGGTLDVNLAYRHGTGAFGALRAPEDAFGAGASRPEIVTARIQLGLPFMVGQQRLRYNGDWRRQWQRTPLTPQDRFAIGGRYTVRGFNGEMMLLAERGWLIRNDVSAALGGSGSEVYWGLDHGEVGGTSAGLLVGQRLTGSVVGLRGSYRGLSWDGFVGGPISNPNQFKEAKGTAGFSITCTF